MRNMILSIALKAPLHEMKKTTHFAKMLGVFFVSVFFITTAAFPASMSPPGAEPFRAPRPYERTRPNRWRQNEPRLSSSNARARPSGRCILGSARDTALSS